MADNTALRLADNGMQPWVFECFHIANTYRDHWKMSSVDLTIAIPTFNGSQRLPEVLSSLAHQAETEFLRWEIVVVDNNSKDDTARVVRHYQSHQLLKHIAIRYAFVAEQGAAFARQRAVEMACGSVIAFLDDDNVPAEDWVINIHRFAQLHPRAGAFGSQVHGQFERSFPEELQSIACFLAVVERGDHPHLYEPQKKILPPGAGLAVRRDVWLQHVPKRLFLNHKGKTAGLASEDLEAVLHIQKAGWEVWHNPNMVVYHHIPAIRLQENYLRALLRCVGLSRFYIRMLGLEEWQRPVMAPIYIANDVRKLVLSTVRLWKAPRELVRICEQEHLKGTLQSPFFIAHKAWKDWYQGLTQNTYQQEDTIVRLIETAFEKDQFQLFQQPVVSLKGAGASISQNEILLRIIEDSLELGRQKILSPAVFIPTANRIGLSNTIDRWVVRKLFHLNPTQTSAQYSINLSAATVCDRTFIIFLDEVLRQSHLAAQQICFEISEPVIEQFPDAFRRTVLGLKEIGCHITVDNLSKLSTLKNILSLAVDSVKLSLLSGPGRVSRPLTLAEIRAFTEGFSEISCVALGIETVSTLEKVKIAGIHYGQGYQLGKPKPLEITPTGYANKCVKPM